jgi:hypothetical protein
MTVAPWEDGLRVTDGSDDVEDGRDAVAAEDGRAPADGPGDGDLESLRDEFVDAFNARDLDAVMAIVAEDIECPDMGGSGAGAVAEELQAIWERSPGAILTRAFVDGQPCAVGWLPDEDGCWSRAAIVCFDAEGSQLTLLAMPDDTDDLERAESDEPTGEETRQGADWSEWSDGEQVLPRHRSRP